MRIPNLTQGKTIRGRRGKEKTLPTCHGLSRLRRYLENPKIRNFEYVFSPPTSTAGVLVATRPCQRHLKCADIYRLYVKYPLSISPKFPPEVSHILRPILGRRLSRGFWALRCDGIFPGYLVEIGEYAEKF